MSNQPARFRQPELARAIRAAKAEGARLAIVDGIILIDPQPAEITISPKLPKLTMEPEEKVAEPQEIDL